MLRKFFPLLSVVAWAFSSCGASEAVTAQSPKKETHELSDWQKQVLDLDREIDEKENRANLYRAKAASAQNRADRLQFNSPDVTEARRFWQLADYYNANAALLEKEVVALKELRTKILHENNSGNPWPTTAICPDGK